MTRAIPTNINEEYYQISREILESFPKFRHPVDLFAFREDIAVLAPFSRKGERLTNDKLEQLNTLCDEGNIFVSRSDHPIYSRHIVKQLDLVLQDQNLKESEIVDICIRALAMRYEHFYDQPVRPFFEALRNDALVVTEYLIEDKHRINSFCRRLFRQHEPARHALNTFSIGLWLLFKTTAEVRRKDLDNIAVALLVHDIGMSKLPPFLLQKKGPLKQEEREKMELHSLAGAKLIQKLEDSTEEMIRACFEHHERIDGSGYPQHTKDRHISRIGRITAVADSFSAMICERPYAMPKEPLQAAQELALDSRYDPEFTRPLNGAISSKEFGELLDMDASLEKGKVDIRN